MRDQAALACCVCEDACQWSAHDFGFDGLRHICAQGWFSLTWREKGGQGEFRPLVSLQGRTWYGWAQEQCL